MLKVLVDYTVNGITAHTYFEAVWWILSDFLYFENLQYAVLVTHEKFQVCVYNSYFQYYLFL